MTEEHIKSIVHVIVTGAFTKLHEKPSDVPPHVQAEVYTQIDLDTVQMLVEENLANFLRAQAIIEKKRFDELQKILDDFWTI
jgi:hypothetical protein